MRDYRRFSTVKIEVTTKRPEVLSYQGALKSLGHLDGKVDGWYGPKSAAATRAFQRAVNEDRGEELLAVNGKIDKATATELIARASDFSAPLNHRIMAVIAFYEVSSRADAFGMAVDDIRDGAGANYGIMQCNRHGSVVAVLRLASREDLVAVYKGADKAVVNPPIQAWFGSGQGIAAQVRYFEDRIVVRAMEELRAFGSFDAWEHDPSMKTWWERAVLLFCDSKIQNGGMWSKRRPFWTDLAAAEAEPAEYRVPELYHGEGWDELLGEHVSYADFKSEWSAQYELQREHEDDEGKARRATTQAVVKRLVDEVIPADAPASKLLVLAQVRARTSSPAWWYRAVVSRRVTDATGSTDASPKRKVNGARLDLAADFQI